jgi:tetratricopeptide (TPR) repeat protein
VDSLLLSNVKLAIKKGENYRKQNINEVESLYYLGVTNGILGIYHVLNSNYLKGYIHGRRGKIFLDDVVKKDSTYYDAYLGLGIFHYYVDLLPGILQFFAKILGFNGDRELGLQEIQLTMDRGQFFSTEGKFAYAMVRYFLEGDYHSTLSKFHQLHNKFPQNPAFTLIIGYHYRRHGQIKKAEKYFLQVGEVYKDKLPQIIVMKYYNLAVCYYRLNEFENAVQYFNRLLDTSLRKSRYYQAAIAHYKGVLAGLQSKPELSRHYFDLIYKNKETKYWYNISRFYANHQFDEVMKNYILANNNIYSLNRSAAEKNIEWLVSILESPGSELVKSDYRYLIRDVQARFAFQGGKASLAKEIYSKMIPDLDNFKDNFQRAWIYISYARVLRELKDWQASEKMLEKAKGSNDDYTIIIIEREKFILKNLQANVKS